MESLLLAGFVVSVIELEDDSMDEKEGCEMLVEAQRSTCR
jgi:hypothetical protein